MDTDAQKNDRDLPYAELVIKPADSRPIVITLFMPSGRVDVSPGTKEDAEEIMTVCLMLMNVGRAMFNVREVAADLRKLHNEETAPKLGDPPF